MNNNLALRENRSVIPTKEEWSTLHEMARSLLPTGFLPSTIKTPEQATAIMLKGMELSIPPMYALSNIVVVQGKPSCSAELMLALVQRDFGAQAMRVKDSTNDSCTVEYRVPGWDDVKSYTFTIQDAEKAGLFKNQVWRSYPAAMLRARCISAVARMAFPSAIGGMYAPGELGDPVNVTDDGEVLSASVDRTTGEIVDVSPHNAPVSTQEGRSATNPVEPPADTSEDVPDYTGDPDDWAASNRYLRKVADAHTPKLPHELTKAWLIAASIKAGNPKTSTKDMSPMALRFLAGRIKENREKVRSAADEALSNPDIYALCYPADSPVEDVFPPKPEVEVVEAEPVEEDADGAPF